MKNKFTKFLSLFTAGIMLLSLLTGCDSEPQTTSDTSSENVSSEEAPYNMDGETLMFLGSSVTYGSASNGRSFVDMIDEKYGCTCIKLAVSGTTLVDNGPTSYVARLKAESVNYPEVDHLIVQLSTNDATGQKRLGKVSDSKELESFDTSCIVGAIEYIIAFAKETWDCKVSFYTGTYYDSLHYSYMVDALPKIQEKWGIGVLNLYYDEEMRAVSDEDYARYMQDPIHPNVVGYEEWWLPKFEEFLLAEG